MCYQTVFLIEFLTSKHITTPQPATDKALRNLVLTEYIHIHRAEGHRRQTDQSDHLAFEEMLAHDIREPKVRTY